MMILFRNLVKCTLLSEIIVKGDSVENLLPYSHSTRHTLVRLV